MVSLTDCTRTQLITPISGTASATANLDTMGSDYAVVTLLCSARLNTSATTLGISLQHADAATGTFSTVTANRSESLASAHQVVYAVDTRSLKRYLRLEVTPGTSTNDVVVIAAHAATGRCGVSPASTTGMVASTNDAVVVV